MEKSQSIKSIAGAVMLFQTKIQPIKKDSSNPFFKSKYASLFAILDNIQIPLAESGLSFVQFPTGDNGLTTILMHSDSGEYIQAEYFMKPSKDDPQGHGSAITYMRRYALGAILGLNIDEDDDANEASKPAPLKEVDANGKEKTWLNLWGDKEHKSFTKEGAATMKKLSGGEVTLETVKQFYKLSREVETYLKDNCVNPIA